MIAPLDRKLWRDVKHLRGQAAALAVVVACGIASYVSMRSTYQSLLITQAAYYEKYKFADVFVSLKRAPEALAARLREIPGVAAVRTRIVVDVTLDVPGLNEPATARLVSIPERRVPMLNDLFIRRGRYMEPGKREEVIVSEAFSEANRLKVGDTLQAVLNGRWKALHIVGIALSPEYVYEVRGGGSLFPDNRRFGVIWMSREALGPAFQMESAFNDVALTLAPGAVPADVIVRLDRWLARYGGLGAYERYDQTSHRFLSDEIAQNKFTSTLVPFIFLSVAAFLLHVVLSRLVTMERHEIGLLKAFGYGNWAIGFHYLKLALVPVLAGAGLGIAVGLYFGSRLTHMYALFYRFPLLHYEASPELVAIAVLMSVGAASLSALGAVHRAMALPPAEAMRPEPPARFQAGFIERIGLHRLLSPAGRMILRNLTRQPARALLSWVGLAVAMAILIIELYFFDAIDHLMNVQFERVQRDDVTVTFNEPRRSRAYYDLNHLPGVIRSEPFRSVPVRLQFEHRVRRTVLLGLDPAGDLRRLVDRNLNALDVPPQGLVLTTKLAEILGVRPGDTLTVAVLEGARPVRSIVVAGLVDELIGVSAYMNRHTLNQLLREGATVSGAYLSIDALTAPRLYAQLKRMPAVSGVSIRQAALASFNETIAASLVISVTTLVIFAGIIAFGIVYNGARVTLSERGRDLASLRVLGFTQREVAYMLLGEQALLTLLAVPLGFALGFGFCALIPSALDSELYRLPLVVRGRTYVFSFIVVAAAAFFSGLFVRWRLRHLDLIAVLKTRE